MDITANTPSDIPTPKTLRVFELVFIVLIVIGNLLLLAAAWQDKGWTALYISIFAGPVLNGAFLVSGLLAIPFLKRRGAQFSVGGHLGLTLGVPIAAAGIDFFAIISMGLHGC
jgi:hypothetical protein